MKTQYLALAAAALLLACCCLSSADQDRTFGYISALEHPQIVSVNVSEGGQWPGWDNNYSTDDLVFDFNVPPSDLNYSLFVNGEKVGEIEARKVPMVEDRTISNLPVLIKEISIADEIGSVIQDIRFDQPFDLTRGRNVSQHMAWSSGLDPALVIGKKDNLSTQTKLGTGNGHVDFGLRVLLDKSSGT